jgi:hypothetical protein
LIALVILVNILAMGTQAKIYAQAQYSHLNVGEPPACPLLRLPNPFPVIANNQRYRLLRLGDCASCDYTLQRPTEFISYQF